MFILLNQTKVIVSRPMQKSFRHIVITVFLALFLFTNQAVAQQQSLRDMLSGNNCPASCYLDIAPGVTTQTELEQILNQNNAQFTSGSLGISGHIVVYNFIVSDLNGFIRNSGDSGYIDVTANTVVQITLFLTNVTVQDVLSLYGAPDAITNSSGNYIIYKSHGLVFGTSPEDPSLVTVAFLQEAIEGRSLLSNFLDTEGCSGSSANCSIPTATPTDTPIYTLTPATGSSPTSTRTPTVTPTNTGYSCPCSIWGTPTPSILAQPDSNAVELGVKFRASVSGNITGLRFYKGSTNTGTHTGHLFSSTGTLLGSLTFSGESASGWQSANFDTPIAIQADTTYIAGYHAPNGQYSIDRPSFASDVVNGPLTALSSSGSGGNGVYAYGSSGTFPTNTFEDTNYWVDVIFTAVTPTATPTFTPGPSPTPTLTLTPTLSPTPGDFPTAGVLDNFNRADGEIGSNWSGQTLGYSISGNQMLVGNGSDNPLYWTSTSYGANQEAYVKFGAINSSADEIDLTLKIQGATWSSSVLEILYNPASNKVQVYTYTSSQDWVQRGADIPVTFAAGDVFGAKAKADGTVEVYKNSTLVGSRDITAWPYYASGGKIGLWMINAGGTILDDFGGGNS